MKLIFSIGPWLLELFNPPLRDSLTPLQKVGRVLLVTATLVTLCVIGALGLAVLCFVYARGNHFLTSEPEMSSALAILAVSLLVNIGCVFALLQIKHLDERLIAPPATLPPEV